MAWKNSNNTSPEKKAGFTFQDVWEVVKLIPHGKVTSYGAIARYLGSTRSSQLVGMAMNASHGKDVPAHRVLNRHGLLTGAHHFGGPDVMKNLLEAEGHTIIDNQLQNFSSCFWDPAEMG